jgi:hypothetical protein
MKAQYWIAQYVEDVFRNEPKNVGIIARIGDEIDAQFIGESKTGEVDGRKLRLFKCPEVYREWIQYWRRMINCGSLDKLLKQTGSNFRVNQGGLVTDIGADTTEAVVTYLYSLLVSEGGFKEALVEDERQRDEVEKALEDEVANMFSQRRLMVDATEDFFVRSPIKRSPVVPGLSCKSHRPAFVQENGRLYVMETADFTTTQKKRQRDHAGLAAYMFKDIRQERQDSETIALVRVHAADLNNDDVEYGLTLLRAEARVVDWFNQEQREAFLQEREAVACN